MNASPIFSVIMPTLNSERTIRIALQSIRSQTIGGENLEILVIDGGSTDSTTSIAAEFGARIIPNPRVQPECAKHEGLLHARGRIALFLDSDEAFTDPRAMEKRLRVLDSEPDVLFVMSGGYRKPEGAPCINDYINLFSDPFSYFMYRISADARFYLPSLVKTYSVERENEDCVVFSVGRGTPFPLADLSAGHSLDLDRLRTVCHAQLATVDIVPLAFMLLVRETGRFAVLKDDVIVHYASDTLQKYLHKLEWRVIVNLHYADREKAGAGFSTRERAQPWAFRLKKYLFIPYGLLVVPASIDAIRMVCRSRCTAALLHPLLTLFVVWKLLWHLWLRTLGLRPTLKPYGARQEALGGRQRASVRAAEINN